MKYLYYILICFLILFYLFRILYLGLHFAHVTNDIIIIWLCSFLLNIAIIFYNKIKILKTYYTFILIILINFLIANFASMYYGYLKGHYISAFRIDKIIEEFKNNYLYSLILVFVYIGNWIFPLIYTLWRLSKKIK